MTTGELVVDRAQIASYNGETLPGTWISDRDVYAEGGTPTTGAQVVYELATPITYHLTPTEITALLGTNNIWADTGDSTVEVGIKLGKLAFQDEVDYSMVAPVEAEMIATRNYTTGEFLIVGTRFYKVTANIASGGTITVGTNVAQTTIAEQLILLLNQ